MPYFHLQEFCQRWQERFTETPQIIRAFLKPAQSHRPGLVFAETQDQRPSSGWPAGTPSSRAGVQPRAPPPRDGQQQACSDTGLKPRRQEEQASCFEAAIAKLGWDPAACWAPSPPTGDSPRCWRGRSHPSPPIICLPFGPPADVPWLRLRKITTSPPGRTGQIFQWHRKWRRNLPCPCIVQFPVRAQSLQLLGWELSCFADTCKLPRGEGDIHYSHAPL